MEENQMEERDIATLVFLDAVGLAIGWPFIGLFILFFLMFLAFLMVLMGYWVAAAPIWLLLVPVAVTSLVFGYFHWSKRELPDEWIGRFLFFAGYSLVFLLRLCFIVATLAGMALSNTTVSTLLEGDPTYWSRFLSFVAELLGFVLGSLGSNWQVLLVGDAVLAFIGAGLGLLKIRAYPQLPKPQW